MNADIAARIRNARGFVFDLDGSLVLGDRLNRGLVALPGSAELLALLDERDVGYRILTNGTVKTPAGIAAALAATGLQVDAAHIMTPSTVAARYFTKRGFRKVIVLGVDAVSQPLVDAGVEVVRPADGVMTDDADAIFVGWYREIRMSEIEACCAAVWNGAGLFAASMVPFFATREGRALGSSMAIAAMITSITGRRATPLGKPSPHALRDAAHGLGCRRTELVVVGDDPDLEVRMALEAGAVAVGLHTGIAGREVFDALPADRRPHLSLPSAADLLAAIRGLG